jgi:hypothetical protein
MLIKGKDLWCKVVIQKYIHISSIKEWIRKPSKYISNVLIVWKATIKYFSLIGNWLVWKVGNGRRIRLGKDPWVSYGNNFELLDHIVNFLRERGFFYMI